MHDDLESVGQALEAAGRALARLSRPQRTPILEKAETEGPEARMGANKDTAKGNPVPGDQAKTDPKSLFWDPFAIVEQLGYKDRPSAVTYGTLKAMAWRTPVLHAVINTRVQQIAAFSRPQHDRYKLGFRLKLRDAEKKPTRAEKKWITEMETLITRTGVTSNPRGRDNFETFLRKLAWDSLVYDQMSFEVVPDKKGQPCEWYAVDAATMRLADSASTYYDEDKADAVRYVQIYDGQVIAEFTQEELCFGVRNPRSDIKLFGYGVSELEMLIPTVTSLLWGFEYNQRFFSQGSTPKGIINFKGTIPEKQLQAFRRHWYQMVSGVENAWRTPVVASDELQYVNLQQSNRDMEFNAWLDFLIKIACSMYQMDPVEVNFQDGNTGQKSAMGEQSNKEKITESRERGLRPILRFIEERINQFIIWPINENFEFDFVGLDAHTKDQVAELNSKRVKTMVTVDELRAEDDLPPLPDGKGELLLDPTWLQFAQMQQAQAEGGEPEEGEEPAEGGEPEEDEADNDQVDFQSLLSQYGGGGKNEEAEKSLRKSVIIDVEV